MVSEEITLRPMCNLSTLALGAGFGIKNKATTEASRPPEERKKPGEIVRYSRDFLMKFAERYTALLPDLPKLEGLIVPFDEASRGALIELTRSADDVANWRQATARPIPGAISTMGGVGGGVIGGGGGVVGGGKGGQLAQPPPPTGSLPLPPPPPTPPRPAPTPPPPPAPPPSASLARAERAYAPADRSGISSHDRALRAIRSILNKLAPEKFERLLNQMLEVITTVHVLSETIALIFEKAVVEPSYASMYADLCEALARELPEWPPLPNDDRPMTFRKVLLNTCHDEFDAILTAHAPHVIKLIPAEERDDYDKRVKQRTLGSIRLVGELFKKDIVPEKIMYQIISDLFGVEPGTGTTRSGGGGGGGGGGVPHEDYLEALCDVLTVAGKHLSEQALLHPAYKKKWDGALVRIRELAEDSKRVSSRVRFLLRDVLELRASGWQPRRQALQAKKLEEIRAEAEQSLGMTIPGSGDGYMMRRDDEPLMFPPTRGELTAPANRIPVAAGAPHLSALVGDVIVPRQASTATSTSSSTAAVRRTGPIFPADTVKTKARSLIREYTANPDDKELLLGMAELGSGSDVGSILVYLALEHLLDSIQAREHELIHRFVSVLFTQGWLSGEEVRNALVAFGESLDDVSVDYPMAPKLLGAFFGSSVALGAVSIVLLQELVSKLEFVEKRREFGAAALQAARGGKGGDALLSQQCHEVALSAAVLFRDEEEEGGVEEVEAWLKKQGLLGILPL